MSISRLVCILCLRLSLIAPSCGLTRCFSQLKVLSGRFLLFARSLFGFLESRFVLSIFRAAFKYLTIMESWWKAIKSPDSGFVGMFCSGVVRRRHGDWMKFENMNVESFLSAFVEVGALIVMWYFSICKCSTTDNEHRKRSWKGRRKFISGRLGLLIGVWGCFCGDIEWHKYLVGSRNFDGRYLFRYSFRESVSLEENGNCTQIHVGWCFNDVIVKQFGFWRHF